MSIRSNIVILLAAFAFSGLFACGATTNEAKGPEANPWADYKGTYATTAGSSAKASKAEVAKAEAKEAAPAPEAAVEETPAPASTAAPAKKAKSAPKAAKAPAKTAAKKK